MPVEVEKADGVHDYDTLIGAAVEAEPAVEVDWNDTALLQYTGGTTGVSKGCRLSNYNLVSIAYQDVGWFAPLFGPAGTAHARGDPRVPYLRVQLQRQREPGERRNDHTGAAAHARQHTGGHQQTRAQLIRGGPHHDHRAQPAPRDPKSKIRSIRGMISGSSPLAVEAMKTFEDLSGATI